jgi:hypothetical protein
MYFLTGNASWWPRPDSRYTERPICKKMSLTWSTQHPEHTRLKSNKHFAELQLQRTNSAFNFACMTCKDKFCFEPWKTLGVLSDNMTLVIQQFCNSFLQVQSQCRLPFLWYLWKSENRARWSFTATVFLISSLVAFFLYKIYTRE